jgi:hypothetical protein
VVANRYDWLTEVCGQQDLAFDIASKPKARKNCQALDYASRFGTK